MAQVKFVNVAKYKNVRYPAHTPFEVDDQDVPALIKQGAIVTIAPEEKKGDNGSEKSVDDMNVEELKAYAKAHNIDIKGIERKADIVAAIKAADDAENDDSEE